MTLNNIRLLTDNFAAMYRFYADVLGLVPAWGDESSTYASFASEGAAPSIALFSKAEMLEALNVELSGDIATMAPAAVVVFSVKNVDEIYEVARAKGAVFLGAPVSRADWGIRVAHLKDPDGNWLELFQELPKSMWSPELVEQSKDQVQDA